MTLRVLIVEDSLTVRGRIREALARDPDIDVVGEAGDGVEAFGLCRRLRPDVVTLDMMLPIASGLEATEQIMAECPTPILIVSASTNRGELFRTYDALAAGAVDVLEKPLGDEPDEVWDARLVDAVKLVAKIKVIRHPRARLAGLGRPRGPARPGKASVVAIGASTGGPAALVEVLGALPPAFPVPVLVVVHIGAPFGTAFAEWLDGRSPHRVAWPVEGEELAGAAGRVVLAPPDRHLEVRGGRLRITTAPPRHSCRPSVDVLFESLAADQGMGVVAALLTGMGRDGAQGLLAVRRAGGATIAQDEATSVVYGMPREAALLGAAEAVLPLREIGPALAERVSR